MESRKVAHRSTARSPVHHRTRAALALPVLLVLSSLPFTARAALLDGLTAYYDLDFDGADKAHGISAASTVADDLAPAGGHPGNFGFGRFGTGGYLGSGPGSGHFAAPDSPDLEAASDNISVSWWGKVASFTAGWQAGVTKGDGNNWRFHRHGVDDTITWQGGGGDIAGAGNLPAVNDGSWHHFVGTKDAASGRVLYIDGVEIATGPPGTPLADTGTPLAIGANPEVANREWSGEIDDVAIWNRALSAAEVAALFDAGANNNLSLGQLLGPEPDSDRDDLNDNWERDHAGNLTSLSGTAWDGTGPTPGPGSATGDFDGDGRSDKEELRDRTNPTRSDSDDDGSSDGAEAARGTDPLDPDSDDDSLLDGVETNTGIYLGLHDTGTDPLNPDTDGDGDSDGVEVNLPGRDPNVNEYVDPEAARGLTAYYPLDHSLHDDAHGRATDSAVPDDLSFAFGHSGDFGPGLFGGGGYLGSGPGSGHATAPCSPDVDGAGDAITVSWWGKVEVFNVAWQAAVSKGEGNNWRFHRRGADPVIAWQGGGGDIAGLAVNIDDGQWHFFAGTKDPAVGRVLYVDGVQVATGPPGSPIMPTNSPLALGANSQIFNREWAGEIDDVAIWNRALAPTEVSTIHEGGLRGMSLADLLFPESVPPSTFDLRVRETGGMLEISWRSEPGEQYDLLSDAPTDLEGLRQRDLWPVFASHSAIPATPPRNTLTIPYPPDPERYFAIRGGPAPPG